MSVWTHVTWRMFKRTVSWRQKQIWVVFKIMLSGWPYLVVMHWKSKSQHYHVKEFVTFYYVSFCMLSLGCCMPISEPVNSWWNCYKGPSAGMPESWVISVSITLNKNYNSWLNVVIYYMLGFLDIDFFNSFKIQKIMLLFHKIRVF